MRHKRKDDLARSVVDACEQAGIAYRILSEEDWSGLPEFNWDVSRHEECAAVHLVDQAVRVLHVVSVAEHGGLVYRTKTLFPLPASIRDSPFFRAGAAFSVSTGGAGETGWKSDCSTDLGRAVAKVLAADSALTGLLVSTGHDNVNAWLEDSSPVSCMAINTAKRYREPSATIDFVAVSNMIGSRIQAGPDPVWNVSKH